MNDLNTYLYSAYFIESIRDRVSTTHMHVTSKEREAITEIKLELGFHEISHHVEQTSYATSTQ